jgi:dihydrofolate reductase
MRTLVASEWMSLDGVFDAELMGEWFNPYDSEERQSYIRKNVETSDAFLLGRVTYEMLASYWPKQKNNEFGIADRLNSLPKYVVSSTLKEAPWEPSTIIKENVIEEIARLKQQSGQSILIFGSATLVQSLMQAGLVDEYRLLVHPYVMGSGKRFFRKEMGKTPLQLVATEPLSRGVVLLRYAGASQR